jgi:hypothetical protein
MPAELPPVPMKTYVMTKVESVYQLDAVFEHVPYPPENLTVVLLYTLFDEWLQEVYCSCRWSSLRDKVRNAMAASQGGPVYVTVFVAALIDIDVDGAMDALIQDDDSEDEDDDLEHRFH